MRFRVSSCYFVDRFSQLAYTRSTKPHENTRMTAVTILATPPTSSFTEIATQLAAIAKSFNARGWMLGTSGNVSAVLQTDPLLIAMSSSGVDKGELSAENFVLINETGAAVHGGKPSDETLLHLEIVRERGAGAVFHTHSVWNTILSDMFAKQGGVAIEGYEMLKGLAEVQTHKHSEWLPIIDNSQDMRELAVSIREALSARPDAHGLLLCKHGLYTWGKNVREAKRHVEILEFLSETLGRTLELKARGNGSWLY